MANLAELPKLDELLAVIDRCSPADKAEFAHEHIRGARAYLLGAMPIELRVNLELARKTLATLDDTKARKKAQKILRGLVEKLIATEPPASHRTGRLELGGRLA